MEQVFIVIRPMKKRTHLKKAVRKCRTAGWIELTSLSKSEEVYFYHPQSTADPDMTQQQKIRSLLEEIGLLTTGKVRIEIRSRRLTEVA